MDASIPFKLGNVLYTLRKRSGITQKVMAEGIITQAQLSNIEKGKVIPLATTLYELSLRLGISIEDILLETYSDRMEYSEEVKSQVRVSIRNREYRQVKRILEAEQYHADFQSSINKQFILWHLGIVAYYCDSDILKSLDFLDRALDLSTHFHIFSAQKIEILNSKAIIYNEITEYKKSIATYEDALKQFQQLPKTSMNYRIKVRIHYGLTKSLHKDAQYYESIKICSDAIQILTREESMYLLGEVLYQRAQSLQSMNNMESATKGYEEARNIFLLQQNYEFEKVVQERLYEIKKSLKVYKD
ncbi:MULTISPECIES: helix-turn-helix domain-containing protein [unclassified Peribacillus]|uniref:helix-turn-helix domain-containing protein n=1 Tax=unclassified Peribacillus TaxID=2675266 RepID=UPI001913A94C|nr:MULTISPECIES: helix-turn-helix domain-containing protein [unclassified Peribacillus]MBK5443182.1 helix-turn-helix transcriptional regulator [Peribacillus sp. TH24]MBK5462076.1 helix-turn-helix transcriptional regulator [Peribacillus sp. TH27]MBK5484585.1 helix-turn-helix transcriptional regulator [Peribacillus sp. TH16]MBK5500231.1 helix-turn-helix transcriptional regulator [Peribacillus sp. TH14]WMX54735.1 helix-turn-helix domain-containing protein [Peribacillus sp. R9-11]